MIDNKYGNAMQKYKDKSVKTITKTLGEKIEKNPKKYPRGFFVYKSFDAWVGIDNVTGEAFTDAFETKQEAINWTKKFA